MSPTLLRWLILLPLRVATLTGLIFTLVTSIIQLRIDVASASSSQSAAPALPAVLAENETTAMLQGPICTLYPGSDVPLRPTGPFFNFLHAIFLIVLLASMVISEFPLPYLLTHRTVRIQDVLERCMPQLSHKWTSTTMLGLGMMALAADVNSRSVQSIDRVGGWLLLAAGFFNAVVGLVFRKCNMKHLRSLDVRKAALATAASSSGLAVKEKVKRYGHPEKFDQGPAAVDEGYLFRRHQFVTSTGKQQDLPKPAIFDDSRNVSPKKRKDKSRFVALVHQGGAFTRLSRHILNIAKQPEAPQFHHQFHDHSHWKYEQAKDAFRHRRTSETPIHTSSHQMPTQTPVVVTDSRQEPGTSLFRLINPFEAQPDPPKKTLASTKSQHEDEGGLRRRASSTRRQSQALRLASLPGYRGRHSFRHAPASLDLLSPKSQGVDCTLLTPSLAERSPGLVEQWRAAAHEARRQAREASAKARRSLQVVKSAKSNETKAQVRERPDNPKRRIGRGVGLEYRSASEARDPSKKDQDAVDTTQALHPAPDVQVVTLAQQTDIKIAQQLLAKAVKRHENHQQLCERSQRRKKRPAVVPPVTAAQGDGQSKVRVLFDDGASFQLVDSKSTHRKSGLQVTSDTPVMYSYL
ncbi:hypothetical protein K437DRAFT_154384 [Tilletiaria anomala UBC 951]|uniref:Uncharacterized protein n=1 Tax=Tilletiaria anomala (strain ATCC 24038 / CBS 436.72 / UBC 951) TaxID=1037660 RepID=A0A066VSF2_TILAU|nr:uncharacterized protein K437DRAFT_154384 [Tilletiaria anomala UBC 951]KDN43213.1 hypothetical protein K437DRAFT_154384 [Tilletiaria anomala UBC 951]